MDRKFGIGKYSALWAFGIAFGYIEAGVVIYLREALGLGAGSLFPLTPIFADPAQSLLAVEVYRELATLVVLLVTSLLVSHLNGYRFLAFVILFALWDLSYYSFLRLHLGWPASVYDFDVLFLIPTLWIAPVICPLLVSGTMLPLASAILYLMQRRIASLPSAVHWALILAGVVLMLYAFMAESAYYLGGGLPPRFPWLTFWVGYALAAVPVLHFTYRLARRDRSRFR